MNALESASLVMIPSGYEDGTLGSLKPTDGTGDFTFSRGSNLSATRINEQGYIEKGYENLLLQSNTFSDAAWSSINLIETGGEAGYDGSNDAWKLSTTTTGDSQRVEGSFTPITGVYNVSIYAKAGTYNQDLYIRVAGATSYRAYFTLSDGSLNGGSNLIDYKSTDVGNGWYRFEATFNFVNALSFEIRFRNSNNAGDYFYVQDAQINQGLVAYPYIETTTAPVAGGILEDEPRIDFSDGCGHLLLEPSRTNLVQSSEYLDKSSTYWSSANVNTILESVENPEGKNATYNICAAATTSVHYFERVGYAGVLNDFYTFSLFAKAGASDFVQIATSTGFQSKYQNFNLSNGTIGEGDAVSYGYDASITPFGNNGWYRISLTAQATTSANARFLVIPILTDIAARNPPFTGDGTSGFYMWGAQVEQDATYPTSYIPTYGVSQTRLADYIDIPSSADLSIPSDSWTILWDISDDSVAVGSRWFDDSLQKIQLYPTSTSKSRVYWRGIGQYIASDGGSKIIARYDGTTATEFHDGVNKGNASYSGQIPFDFYTALGTNSGKYIFNKFIIFPTALSDDECIALTTI